MTANLRRSAATAAAALWCALSPCPAAPAPPVRSERWAADAAHSSVQFRLRHWGIVDIIGWFEDFEVRVRTRGDGFTAARVEARVYPHSLRMPNPDMAANARRLFAAAGARELVFRSARVVQVEEGYDLAGTLTAGAVTLPVRWTVALNGFAVPPAGTPGFTARTEIARRALGIGGDEFLQETGQPMLGHTVEVTANIRLDWADE